MEDKQLIDLFWKRDKSAIQEAERVYSYSRWVDSVRQIDKNIKQYVKYT